MTLSNGIKVQKHRIWGGLGQIMGSIHMKMAQMESNQEPDFKRTSTFCFPSFLHYFKCIRVPNTRRIKVNQNCGFGLNPCTCIWRNTPGNHLF
jgi:hypothetical protein